MAAQQKRKKGRKEKKEQPKEILATDIEEPGVNDVLSGRGNFVNYHPGNEFFRSLVKHYRMDYVQAPKNEKASYAVLIYDKIKQLEPPGKYLKQDNDTKLWFELDRKKSIDKTRQALREGAPEIERELRGETENKDNGEESDKESVELEAVASNDGAGKQTSESMNISSEPQPKAPSSSAQPEEIKSSATIPDVTGSASEEGPSMNLPNLLTQAGQLSTEDMKSILKSIKESKNHESLDDIGSITSDIFDESVDLENNSDALMSSMDLESALKSYNKNTSKSSNARFPSNMMSCSSLEMDNKSKSKQQSSVSSRNSNATNSTTNRQLDVGDSAMNNSIDFDQAYKSQGESKSKSRMHESVNFSDMSMSFSSLGTFDPNTLYKTTGKESHRPDNRREANNPSMFDSMHMSFASLGVDNDV